MNTGIIIKHSKINKILVLPEQNNSELFQIIPIINEELSSSENLENSLKNIIQKLSDLNILNAEFLDVLAEIN